MLFLGKQTLLILSVGFFLATKSKAESEKIAYDLARTAEELMTSSEKQKGVNLTYSFEDPSRENWHFFPNWSGRTGVPLYRLSKDQRMLVQKMVELLLSEDGFLEYENLRLIHGIRKDLNAPDNPMHRYSISIFGKPSIKSTWGWRLEGHHLSLNCTLVDGQTFSITPSFWGASPVRVSNGKYAGLELFEQEQELSLELVNSLSASQKQQAKVGSGNGPEAVSRVSREEYENLSGIPFIELTESQQEWLEQLILLFAEKYRPAIVEQINDRKKIFDPSTLRFSYVYSSRGYVAYFCIITSEYLIEFDNQGGNHIHAAWRDFDGDFGRGLLSEHLVKERLKTD
ncbi:MAG: DUF3500 domain-containing protein [Opitutae bacterium]|nr:DUF3500 domain-containing protein [Opitutae bacterium]